MASAKEGWDAVDRVILLLERLQRPYLIHDLIGNLSRAPTAATHNLRFIETSATDLANACNHLIAMMEEKEDGR